MQRVWRVTDPAEHARINEDLGPRQALIADGHHRYATYRRLQAERRAGGEMAGPWDRGLALLVDSVTYPLRLAAIHRVVEDLALADALLSAADVFDGLAAARATSTRQWRRCRPRPVAHPFVLTDGSQFWLLCEPAERVLAAALPRSQSELWRSLDASVLDAVLLERLWSVDPEQRAGALCPRRRRCPAGSATQQRDRRAAQAGRRRRRARRRRPRRADAAQVDVVRPEAAHRARPAPARRATPEHAVAVQRSHAGRLRGAIQWSRGPPAARCSPPPRCGSKTRAADRQNRRRSAPRTSTTSPGCQVRTDRWAAFATRRSRWCPRWPPAPRPAPRRAVPRTTSRNVTTRSPLGSSRDSGCGSEPTHQVHLVGVLAPPPASPPPCRRPSRLPRSPAQEPLTPGSRERIGRGRWPPRSVDNPRRRCACGRRPATAVDKGQSSAPSSASRKVTPESSASAHVGVGLALGVGRGGVPEPGERLVGPAGLAQGVGVRVEQPRRPRPCAAPG